MSHWSIFGRNPVGLAIFWRAGKFKFLLAAYSMRKLSDWLSDETVTQTLTHLPCVFSPVFVLLKLLAELQTLADSRSQFYQQANENGMVKQVRGVLRHPG